MADPAWIYGRAQFELAEAAVRQRPSKLRLAPDVRRLTLRGNPGILNP